MAEGFRILSQRILLCANRSRPIVEFLIEISEILVSFSKCDSLELWLREKGSCSRWVANKKPNRFYRLGNVSEDLLVSLVCQGVFWTNELAKTGAADDHDRIRSLVRIPLAAGEEKTGVMLLKSLKRDFFTKADIELYQHVAQTVAIAVAYQRLQLDQRERVKELTCLYEIARTAAQPRKGVEQILRDIVEHLPPACQYPEIASARIILDGQTYATENFAGGRHILKANIVMEGEHRGVVEVSYQEDKPEMDEGPFLVEERRLLDTVAREVVLIIERKKAEADRVRLQEQLRHADRLATIGQLAAGVAHELNEPLGGILGFAQLAKKHPDLPGQVSQDLSKIESASLHAREVVRKLMLFARQTPPSKKRVNLNDIVEEGLFFLESRCVKAGIELKRFLQPDLPEIIADPAQLHQVLVNLVVNAVQASPEGGELSVETARSADRVLLIVSDTGVGMTKEVLGKIFVPFFTTKEVGEGTGLGLPVVHGIVTSHGGQIDVESRPGRGARFTIHLPLNYPQEQEPED